MNFLFIEQFMIRIAVFVLLIVIFSCKKSDRFPDVTIIGHAGSGLHSSTSPFHSNSLESIQYAMNCEGVSGVEVDVQLSKNGSIWLFHDTNLNPESSGEGCINSKEDSEIDELNFKSLEKEELRQLYEIPNLFAGKNLILDIRQINDCTAQFISIEQLIAAIQYSNQHFSGASISVITHVPEWIDEFQALGWKVFLNASSLSNYHSLNNWQQSDGVCIRNSEISKDETQEIINSNKKVIIFEVRSPKSIRSALKKKPTFLMTDDLKTTLIEKYR